MLDLNLKVKTRLGCDNCGREDIYEVPVRHIIEDWSREDGEPSSYSYPDGKDYHILSCKSCQIPRLKVFWWKEDEETANVPH